MRFKKALVTSCNAIDGWMDNAVSWVKSSTKLSASGNLRSTFSSSPASPAAH
jgi:hypothetical protein